MNAREIAVALTGRLQAEELLRKAFGDLIRAEATVQAQFANLRGAADEADAFYCWEGRRAWGRLTFPQEGSDSIPMLGNVSLEFATTVGGFTVSVPTEEGTDDTFLPNEVLDASVRSDQAVIVAYAKQQAEMLLRRRAERRETIRSRYAAVELLLPHINATQKTMMSAFAQSGDQRSFYLTNGRIDPQFMDVFNHLTILGLMEPVGGAPTLTTLGHVAVKRFSGDLPDLAQHWGA